MGVVLRPEVVTLNGARVALALGRTDDVDFLAGFEGGDVNLCPGCQLLALGVFETKFDQANARI